MSVLRVPSWATMAILTSCGMLVSLQQTLVIPLLPDLPEILNVSADDASWLVTATLLAGAVATPIVSRMADMYGKRKMLLVSLAVMTVGSLIAALGANFPAMLLGRAMQGFGASLIPVGMSIMRDQLPREKLAGGIALVEAARRACAVAALTVTRAGAQRSSPAATRSRPGCPPPPRDPPMRAQASPPTHPAKTSRG